MRTLCVLLAVFASVFADDASTRHLTQVTAPAPAPCTTTVADVAAANNLTSLLAAVEASGLTATLTAPDLAVTLFAPTNDAFAAALEALNATLDEVASEGLLGPVLEYHVLATPYTGLQLQADNGVALPTLLTPQTISPNVTDGDLYIDGFGSDALVVQSDVPACQTIVHVIDAVLVPNFDLIAPAPAPSVSST